VNAELVEVRPTTGVTLNKFFVEANTPKINWYSFLYFSFFVAQTSAVGRETQPRRTWIGLDFLFYNSKTNNGK
jgi:hypothetical protein